MQIIDMFEKALCQLLEERYLGKTITKELKQDIVKDLMNLRVEYTPDDETPGAFRLVLNPCRHRVPRDEVS